MAGAARAFVRGVADTFANGLKMAEPGSPISLPLAREQHTTYTSLLRQLLPSVHVIPPDNTHPDCCFIEDTAVVVPEVVVASRPGHDTRVGEVPPVAQVLQQVLGMTLKHIQNPGSLDGGDVLRMGRHLLVGMGSRTNQQAVQQLQHHVEPHNYTVHPVPIAAGLHLKSAVTALDDNTILYSADVAGKDTARQLQRLPHLQTAAFVEVPDTVAANVLRVGNNVVMQLGCKDTEQLLEQLCKDRQLVLHKLPRMTEFIKADGALTCLSIIC